MKMDKKLKLRGGGEELNSPPGALLLDPAGGSIDPRLGSRCARARQDPLLGQMLDPPLHVGSGSEVPEAEHIAITILQRCVNQKPRKFFSALEFPGGDVPLSSSLRPW